MTFPKEAKLQGQKIEQWLPEPGTGGRVYIEEAEWNSGGAVRSILYLDPGGGYVTE